MGARAKTTGTALLAITMLAAASVTGLAGCTSRQPEPQVISGDRLKTSGLTPVERGRIRETVLKVAHEGFDAWVANDVTAMKAVWAPSYVDYYTKLYAGYREAGKVRVRKYDVKNFDMVELSEKGDEAIVQVFVTDRSYYANAKGTALSKPPHRDTYLQLTLDKGTAGAWTIARAIMGNDLMK